MHTWTWVLILTLGLIKLPIAALMLWVPFRSDAALAVTPPAESADSTDDDDGGSKTLPGGVGGGGRGPHPHPRAPLGGRGPRRGPHGAPAPPSPARVRTMCRSATRVRIRQ